VSAVGPKLQRYWDWRAAANFVGGGTGSGLLIVAALASGAFGTRAWTAYAGTALVAAGLGLVWLEIGRPWRFLHVFFNARTSWMTREAMAALPLVALGVAAALTRAPALAWAAAALGAVFLYCQARILQASKGIPAWRVPEIVPLILATGLTEGAGAFLVGIALVADTGGRFACVLLLALIAARVTAWRRYRLRLETGGPKATRGVLARAALPLAVAHALAAGLAVAALVIAPQPLALWFGAGAIATLTGWVMKFIIVTRAAHDQGYAIEQSPVRGSGPAGPGTRPGWS
jgi:phenylacetyl-CoA:acceptor oxidoreductase subunit 2